MKQIIFAIIFALSLVGCAGTDPGRPKTAYEQQFSGKYISTTDTTRSMEFTDKGEIYFTGKCVFKSGWWFTEAAPASIGAGFVTLESAPGEGVSIPGYDWRCHKKDNPNCLEVVDICTNDKFKPFVSIAGNCFTAKDRDGSSEQFCK